MLTSDSQRYSACDIVLIVWALIGHYGVIMQLTFVSTASTLLKHYVQGQEIQDENGQEIGLKRIRNVEADIKITLAISYVECLLSRFYLWWSHLGLNQGLPDYE